MDSQRGMWMLLESSGFCLPINLTSITKLKSNSCLCLSFSTFYLYYYRKHVLKIFELFMLAFLLSFLPSVNIRAKDVFMNWERTFRFFGKYILFEKQIFVFLNSTWESIFGIDIFWWCYFENRRRGSRSIGIGIWGKIIWWGMVRLKARKLFCDFLVDNRPAGSLLFCVTVGRYLEVPLLFHSCMWHAW